MHVEFTIPDQVIKILQALIFCLGFTLCTAFLCVIVCSGHINRASRCSCEIAPRYFRVGCFTGLAVSLMVSICIVSGALSWKSGFQWAGVVGAIMLAILAIGGGFIAGERRK